VKAETTPPGPSLELRASRFDLVSHLADDLAHEIKNPLHAMVINLEVLRRRVGSGAVDAALERADVIEHELQRVHRLIDQVLQLLRPARDGVASAEVGGALEDIAPLVAIRARAARLAFRHEHAEQELYVGLPAESLKLAILAASAAAIAATRGTGGELALGYAAAGAMVRVTLTVTEAAPGLRAEDQVTFVNALAVANTLMQEGGGTASCADHTGGTGFTILLEIPAGGPA
jgi:two-component system, NtrC family, C4-dicarboxylate transport sensor histidine kinase DctB